MPTAGMIFNDVLFRMKVSDEIRDPLRVFVTDKEQVKQYVRDRVGDKYNVPTLGILTGRDQVDAFPFPPDCCIKPTHASAEVVIRRNDTPLDRERIKGWFALDYYRQSREANYRTLQPKVIIEPLVFNNTSINDYKIFCFNGVPKMIQVDFDRHTDHKRLLFDTEWNLLPISLEKAQAATTLDKPGNLAEMLFVASELSKEFSFVRIDFYTDGLSCLVGEITHCHGGAGERFFSYPEELMASELIFN